MPAVKNKTGAAQRAPAGTIPAPALSEMAKILYFRMIYLNHPYT